MHATAAQCSLLIALAALLPVAVTVLARPAMYNGIRHFVFVLPPLAVLGGLAGAWLLERAQSHRGALRPVAVALFAIGIVSPVVEMVRLHPYEYTHFNRIAGGVAGARDRYMLDYWALSFKQASLGLKAKLAELGLEKPAGRRWKLAICGPHRSPQVELGPDFETTWDPQGRRLRHDAGRVLLPQVRRAALGRGRARRRRSMRASMTSAAAPMRPF